MQRIVLFVIALCTPSLAHAQAGEVFKRVAFDPTTYVPAAVAYESYRQDWNTSQVFFQHGWMEANPRYTVSGFQHDAPVSYREGNRRIAVDAARVLGMSALHNFVELGFEQAFVESSEHKLLIRTLGWIERIAFASVLTYRQSSQHFQQAERNRQLAVQFEWK